MNIKNRLIMIVSGILVPVLMCFSFSGSCAVLSAQGDINSVHTADIIDFIQLRHALCTPAVQNTDIMDYNNDGSVNVLDIVTLEKYLLGISELPERYQHAREETQQVYASDDLSVRSDSKSDDPGLITVSGYNALARRNVYLKFQTHGIDLNNVSKAQIRLKLADTTNGDCEIKACACSSDWSESNPPSFDRLPQQYGFCDVVVTKHPDDQGSVICFDVTDVVRDNKDADQFNFVLYCDHENNSDALSNLAFFCSKEYGQQADAPVLEVTRNSEKDYGADAVAADNAFVRLEMSQKAGRFVRVSNGRLTAARNVSPLSDAKFRETQGFCGAQTVTLESKSEPGYYLCRKNSSSEIILAQDDGSDQFRKNASFIKTKGPSGGIGYRLYDSCDRWLRCNGDILFAGSCDNDSEKASASFEVRSEANVMLDEEFDGSELDTSVWNYSYPWSDHHNYSAVVRKSQVAVRDGRLILTATRVADDDWIKDDKGETGYTDKIGENKWRKYSHLTGVIHLPYSRYPLSGNVYIEGSFRMPDASGFWPAFWLNGNNSWPPEIDMFEYLSNTPEKIYVGIHRQDSSKANSDGGAGWWITRNPSFFQKEFHTYALDWGKTYINYYIDDVLVHSVEDSAFINNQKNMYMIINLGVGGWGAEPEDKTGDNTTFECDYVHIFRY